MNLTQIKQDLNSNNPEIRQQANQYMNRFATTTNTIKENTRKATVATVDSISVLLTWIAFSMIFLAVVTSLLKNINNKVNSVDAPSINSEAQTDQK